MFLTSPISSLRIRATRTLLSCSTRTPSSLTLWCLPSGKTPQTKVRGVMVLLIVRGLPRRPSLSGTPTVTFCCVHIHTAVAKKRDASTDLLRRLHGYMKQHNVDFNGGRLQHECLLHSWSRIQSFQHLAFSFCGDLLRWKSRTVSTLGFSLCQSVHMSGVRIHMAATIMITQRLDSDLVIKPLTFLCSYISVPLTYLELTASCAQKRRMERRHHKDDRARRRTCSQPSLPRACECQSFHTSHDCL